MDDLIVAAYRSQTVYEDVYEQTFVCAIWLDHQPDVFNEILLGKEPKPPLAVFFEN